MYEKSVICCTVELAMRSSAWLTSLSLCLAHQTLCSRTVERGRGRRQVIKSLCVLLHFCSCPGCLHPYPWCRCCVLLLLNLRCSCGSGGLTLCMSGTRRGRIFPVESKGKSGEPLVVVWRGWCWLTLTPSGRAHPLMCHVVAVGCHSPGASVLIMSRVVAEVPGCWGGPLTRWWGTRSHAMARRRFVAVGIPHRLPTVRVYLNCRVCHSPPTDAACDRVKEQYAGVTRYQGLHFSHSILTQHRTRAQESYVYRNRTMRHQTSQTEFSL